MRIIVYNTDAERINTSDLWRLTPEERFPFWENVILRTCVGLLRVYHNFPWKVNTAKYCSICISNLSQHHILSAWPSEDLVRHFLSDLSCVSVILREQQCANCWQYFAYICAVESCLKQLLFPGQRYVHRELLCSKKGQIMRITLQSITRLTALMGYMFDWGA